jgi:23S rRNA (uracil1939-C5)-methyltransferase
MTLPCDYAGKCGGCKWIERPYSDQLTAKRDHLIALWRENQLPETPLERLEIIQIAEGGLRDRADMTLHREASGKTHLGLWDVDRSEILDLERCPQMSPALAAWFADFRKLLPEIQFGSVRLRVSPDGTRGIWLDFPNKVIADLLKDRSWLDRLREHAVVEIGQRRKMLETVDDRLKLGKPVLNPWFQTYLGDHEQPQPLYCTIGAFTQPGFEANRLLINKVRQYLQAIRDSNSWLELGSGIGNFTLPIAHSGKKVTALEMDPLACTALERSAKESGLSGQIRISRGNMHRKDAYLTPLIEGQDGILADPPRSGIGSFTDHLGVIEPEKRPAHFIYVSCFAESLCSDLKKLETLGYQIKEIAGIDQFPQSPHCEWALLLENLAFC